MWVFKTINEWKLPGFPLCDHFQPCLVVSLVRLISLSLIKATNRLDRGVNNSGLSWKSWSWATSSNSLESLPLWSHGSCQGRKREASNFVSIRRILVSMQISRLPPGVGKSVINGKPTLKGLLRTCIYTTVVRELASWLRPWDLRVQSVTIAFGTVSGKMSS